jgi:hypothetical protein
VPPGRPGSTTTDVVVSFIVRVSSEALAHGRLAGWVQPVAEDAATTLVDAAELLAFIEQHSQPVGTTESAAGTIEAAATTTETSTGTTEASAE